MSSNGKLREKFSPITITMFVFLMVYVVILLFLLLWGGMVSLRNSRSFNLGSTGLITRLSDLRLVNFRTVFRFANSGKWNPDFSRAAPLDVMLLNTLLYSIGGAFLNVSVTCLMAYLSARYKYFFSKVIYTIVIVVMIVPIVGAQASEIQMLEMLHLYDTRLSFIVLKASFVAGVYFLVFHAAFQGIPDTYSEAAMVDGAGHWCIMMKICLPLVLNVFTTVFLITFIQYWNDYQLALVYMPSYPTLSYFIFSFQSSQISSVNVSGWNGILDPTRASAQIAAAFVLVVPTATIFIALHEKLMGNLSVGGIKG